MGKKKTIQILQNKTNVTSKKVQTNSKTNAKKPRSTRTVRTLEVIDMDNIEQKSDKKLKPDTKQVTKVANDDTETPATVDAKPISALAERSKKRPQRIIITSETDTKDKTTDLKNEKSIIRKKFIKSKNNSNHQEVDNNQDMKLPLLRRIHIKPQYIVLGVFLLILAAFVARVAIWEHNYILAKEGSERDVITAAPSEEGGVYEGGQEVDNTKPTETEIIEYHVAADKPRYLTIRSIGIYNARVVEIGLKNNGEVGTPYNIYDVGWYVDSALPGSNGVSLMDAHGGDLGYGIFRNLPKINIGDQIIIEMGDETTKYVYNVVDMSFQNLGEAANAYMSTALTSPEAGRPSLTLITCTGDWWEQSQTYSQRLFVRAVLQE